jgi:hypothetical protein
MTFKNVQKSISYLSIIGFLLFVSCQSRDEIDVDQFLKSIASFQFLIYWVFKSLMNDKDYISNEN